MVAKKDFEIDNKEVGTRNLYSLAPDGLTDAQQWLVQQWDTALASFAEAVRDDPSDDRERRPA